MTFGMAKVLFVNTFGTELCTEIAIQIYKMFLFREIFNDAFQHRDYIALNGRMMNAEFERTWKVAVVT
jgi:hypothetical protein